MITHSIPDGEAAPKNASAGQAPECPAPVNQGRHGPFRVPLCVAARCQGAGVDPGIVPRGARARRVRGTLLLSRRWTGRRSMPAATRCSKEIETLIARFSPYSEEREQFSAALYGTSEVLKIDGEGRVILTEPLKSHAGIKDEVAFVGLGHKFQIWELGTLSRGTRGGHREGPRAQEAARLPGSGGRSAWSTGMMAGSDSGHCCRWRTGPSHSRARPPCGRVARCARRRRLCRRHVRRRRL